MILEMLTQPARHGFLSLVFVSLIPIYIVIAQLNAGRTVYMPETALDRAMPLQPAWALIYGSHLLLMLLPWLVVRQEKQIRRTVLAYLTVWALAYVCFLVYPTKGPRPAIVIGEGFFAWGLRAIYSADPPYNCFPSLHVAHSFVSALTCYRVHRGVGFAVGLWASLIGVSTLCTKQHYIADVIAGTLLAYVAWVVFLRSCPREAVPEFDRRLAPVLALGVVGIFGLMVAGFWVAYQIRG